ncbi:hypothetical protein [Mycolicibacterium septicum]|uniref:hypothetical protein n=1 Tax=Mycolicibacterium septicum TaxID=98668 RepID=UPI001AF515E1|nr:hypothetical protein [Mycolicibacterium septicum]QRY50542.1 hypothetical protein JVX95_24170 [Mycolicibacterium septicum]
MRSGDAAEQSRCFQHLDPGPFVRMAGFAVAKGVVVEFPSIFSLAMVMFVSLSIRWPPRMGALRPA